MARVRVEEPLERGGIAFAQLAEHPSRRFVDQIVLVLE
jgi:hypothetical protein